MLTGRIFAGHLRSIIGSMTVEEIVTERQKLATEVLDGSKAEMAKIGLTVDSLQIQSIDDMGAGYIDGDGRAAQRRDPAAGQDRPGAGRPGRGRGPAGVAAQAGRVRPADRGRAGAVQGRDRQGPGRGRPGRPAGPGPGAAGGASPRRPSWPSAQAELRQQQLVAEVVKPAEAEAERVRILAQADAERMQDPGRGGRLEQPGRAGPDADRPAAADRQGGGGRPGRRQRQRAQRRRRARRDRRRPGQPGPDDPRLGPQGRHPAARRHHRPHPERPAPAA